jgi:hypothetical protein
MPQKPTDATTFWSHVKIVEGACWEWQAWRDKDGYGRISFNDRPTRAHRLAYMFGKGPVPAGMCVCHSCDNPPCCNPEHLWLGTSPQNTEDSKVKGRKKAFALRGELHPLAFLSDDDVVRLRQLRSRGWRVTDLADIFCVSKQMVSCATLGIKWAHLPTFPFERKAVRGTLQ